jgi:hypothetical protein
MSFILTVCSYLLTGSNSCVSLLSDGGRKSLRLEKDLERTGGFERNQRISADEPTFSGPAWALKHKHMYMHSVSLWTLDRVGESSPQLRHRGARTPSGFASTFPS